MSLPAPGFHHLHLNSVDPDAAIDFYIRQFPTSSRGEWAGLPALLAPNNCMILFNTVQTPAPSEPQSAIWHFGWHVPDARATLNAFKARPEVTLQPLYTTEEGGFVLINSDTWPNVGGVLGLTKAAALEYGRRNNRVNAVCPGYVLTPMQEAEFTPEMLAEVNGRIPLGRHATPEEIAGLFAYLASDEATYFTGAVIVMDGGETAGSVISGPGGPGGPEA